VTIHDFLAALTAADYGLLAAILIFLAALGWTLRSLPRRRVEGQILPRQQVYRRARRSHFWR